MSSTASTFSHTEVARLISSVVNNGQSHLLKHIHELNAQDLDVFYSDLKQLDFALLRDLYTKYIIQKQSLNEFNEAEVSIVEDVLTLEQQTPQLLADMSKIGLESIAKREVAVILLAGGQGTRLGYSKPKGMFQLDTPSQKTIFQYYAEKLKTLSRHALSLFPEHALPNDEQGRERIAIQFYLMTSVVTDAETKEYFESNNNFGISSESIHYFVQGYLPTLNAEGKVLLEDKNKIFLSPNGNGGVYDSLHSTGVLDKLNNSNIKYVQMMGVDNILGKFSDPDSIGLLASHKYDIVSKYAKKRSAAECVGIHVLNKGKFSIMEYSDMTAAQKNKVNESGDLVYDKSFLCNFMCSLDFLNRITADTEAKAKLLAYHLANKQVSYFDAETEKHVVPTHKNAYKFELFIFDSFPLAKSFCLVEVKREEQFAPIKNSVAASENDNPRTAVDQLAKLHQSWLKDAGYTFDFTAAWDKMVEVDPNLSYFGENIPKLSEEDQANNKGHITTFPFYLK